MRNLLVTLTVVILATPSSAAGDLPLFGDGYPESGDTCRRVGESAYTNKYLDDTRDLVACPEGDASIDALIKSGAEDLETVDGQVLLSVPSTRPGP